MGQWPRPLPVWMRSRTGLGSTLRTLWPGSIIVFHPGCTTEGTTGNLPVVHGVVEVKVEQRRYSYGPKGDARRRPTGAGFPQSRSRDIW